MGIQTADDSTTSSTTKQQSQTKLGSNLTALQQLQSPDGYYRYLSITKRSDTTTTNTSSFLSKHTKDASSNNSSVVEVPDKDQIERNFRKLSLRHHPDRPTGDTDTFRALKRAKQVLTDDKLRKEYDLLGLDLEEDQETEDHQENGGTGGGGGSGNDSNGDDDDSKSGNGTGGKGSGGGGGSNPDTVIGHMASATIASILQTTVRTILLGFLITVVTRYTYLLYPILLFLGYSSYRIFGAYPTHASGFDVVSPLLIATCMYVLYSERRKVLVGGGDGMDDGNGEYWGWRFYIAETVFATTFAVNSSTGGGTNGEGPVSRPSWMVWLYGMIGSLVCLWTRGRLLRYGLVVFMELGLALMAVLVFPIMEMVFEEIMREKLKKVGEKVRAYAKVLEEEVMVRNTMSSSSSKNDIGGGKEKKEDVLKKRYGAGSSSSSNSGGID